MLTLANLGPVRLKQHVLGKIINKRGELPYGIILGLELLRYVNSCYSNCTISYRILSNVV